MTPSFKIFLKWLASVLTLGAIAILIIEISGFPTSIIKTIVVGLSVSIIVHALKAFIFMMAKPPIALVLSLGLFVFGLFCMCALIGVGALEESTQTIQASSRFFFTFLPFGSLWIVFSPRRILTW